MILFPCRWYIPGFLPCKWCSFHCYNRITWPRQVCKKDARYHKELQKKSFVWLSFQQARFFSARKSNQASRRRDMGCNERSCNHSCKSWRILITGCLNKWASDIGYKSVVRRWLKHWPMSLSLWSLFWLKKLILVSFLFLTNALTLLPWNIT